MAYSEITMSLKERQKFLEDNRGKFTPERLLLLTTRLNNDRIAAASRYESLPPTE